MTTNRTVTTNVGYSVNQSSVAQVQAANQQVAASFSSAQAAAATMSAAVLALNPGLAQLASAGQQVVATNNQVASSFNAAAVAAQGAIDAEDSASKARQAAFLAGGDSGGGGVSVGGLRGGLRAGGFLLGSEAGGGAVRAAGQIVTLGSAFGVVGVVAGIAALAVRGYTDSLQASTERAKAFGDALEKAFSSTSGGISDFQKTTQAQIAADTAVRDALKKLADAAPQQLTTNLNDASQSISNFLNNAAGSTELVKPISDASISQEAYNAEVADYNKKIQLAQIALDAYNAAIGANIVVTNDATAANQEEANTLVRNEGFRQQAEKATSVERQQHVKDLQAEIDGYQALADSGLVTGDSLTKLTDKIYTLKDEQDTYRYIVQSTADTLADIAQRSDAVNNLFDAITAENEAEKKVIAARQDVADAASDHADKLRQIATDEADKETADRQKAAQTAEDDQAKHLQKLADIDAQYASDHEAAVGNRDALANYQAAQKRDDATNKENAAYTLQEQQLQAHLADQLEQDRAAQRKQIEAENASYNKRNAQLIRALNEAQVEESRAAGLALAYQRQANDAQLNERIRANNNVAVVQQSADNTALNVEIQHQSAMISAAYYGAATIETAFIGLLQRVVTAVNNTYAGGSYVGINNPGGHSLIGGSGSSDAYLRSIVNNQVARMMADANR